MSFRANGYTGAGAGTAPDSPFVADLPGSATAVRQEALEGVDPFGVTEWESPFLSAEAEAEAEWESVWREESSAGVEDEAHAEAEQPVTEGWGELEASDDFGSAEDEVAVCHECGQANEAGRFELESGAGASTDEAYAFEDESPFLEAFEEEEEAELPAQDAFASEAELGVGEMPSFEALHDEETAPAGIQSFATTLGAEWSRRRNGSPTAAAMTQWLLQDYRDTLRGARLRWKKVWGRQSFTDEGIGRAWMISREENMKFQLGTAGLRPFGPFAPPAARGALVPSPLVEDSKKAPVSQLVVRFVEALRRGYKPYMKASNYRGHGGGSFNGRGHSLDLYIDGLDDRGFYPPAEAVKFLRAVHEAATSVGAQWRVIYNDFAVADVVNRALGKAHVIFVGKTRKTNGVVSGLNWHGPKPLILHFHLDLAPLSGSASVWSGGNSVPVVVPSTTVPSSTPSTSSTAASSPQTAGALTAERVRFAQQVLNLAEQERLAIDGDLGPKTRAALSRFRGRHNLGAGGVLDAATELALAQRALEELAQASMFAQVGILDSVTEAELRRFKAARGLGQSSTLDAATRAALVAALQSRAGASPKSSSSAPASGAPASGTVGGKVDTAVVARIDRYRALIDRVATGAGVSPHLMRGIIAAESSGNERTGAGKGGYKGLMQCDRDEAQLNPETSLRCGAKKYLQFTASMRRFYQKSLRQSFDALPEDTRIRIIMASYNAGPVTVQRAMRFAAAAGDVNQWLAPEHYLRALVSTGAYNPVERVVTWCVTKGHLGADDLAADLATLSGTSVEALRLRFTSSGKWSVANLAKALRPLLFKQKSQLKNDGSVTLDAARARATPTLLCAAQFKQSHTNGYLEKVLRYKRFFEARG